MEKKKDEKVSVKDEKVGVQEDSLYGRLLSYGRSDYAAFHMPGHKRQVRPDCVPEGLPWQIDITEIDGFDNLHHAEGILKDSMDMAAAFYGSRKTLYSINGSTAGILSAIFAVTKPGDTILMGRNCHKSVYHAVFLRGLRPLYLYPQIHEKEGFGCGYSAKELKEMLISYPQIRAVILTSPTYEGVISDIEEIAKAVHQKNIPLIVDEAHGAHLAVSRQESVFTGFPVSAVSLGADLVIQSLHKTLPSLTQTALLHVCGDLADGEEAARYMSIFQTSSPSYVLMASIDSCLRWRMSAKGREESRAFHRRLCQLRDRLEDLRHIHLIVPEMGQKEQQPRSQAEIWDPAKLVITADGMTGRELYDRLREDFHLQPEMCTGRYVLLMTSVFDTEAMYERLYRALEELDRQYESRNIMSQNIMTDGGPEPAAGEERNQKGWFPRQAGAQIYIPAQADLRKTEEIPLIHSVGRVSVEYAYQYPPGIPLLVPGEEITEAVLNCLLREKEAGLEIQGLRDSSGEKILVTEK